MLQVRSISPLDEAIFLPLQSQLSKRQHDTVPKRYPINSLINWFRHQLQAFPLGNIQLNWGIPHVFP